MRLTTAIPVALAVFSLYSEIHAATIISTFGPAQSYDAVNGWGIGGGLGSFFGQTQLAVPFTPSTTYVLDRIDVAKQGVVEVQVTGTLGGVPLESFTSFSGNGAVSSDSIRHPQLDAGTQYWLVMTTDLAHFANAVWQRNDQGITGNLYYSNYFGPWTLYNFGPPYFDNPVLPAFAVDGTAANVPEPGTLALCVCGLTLVWGLKRRGRSNKLRLSQ